ncbi:hypothetical protein HED54_12125 [Ochrobactrum anthropi ATCC 49188]|nr:hypothetical protein [Brucella anthropi ATCC 49188]
MAGWTGGKFSLSCSDAVCNGVAANSGLLGRFCRIITACTIAHLSASSFSGRSGYISDLVPLDAPKIDILLWLYWASPVLFYISYIHGQLDVIPVALQFLCVYCITSGRPTLAAVTFGLALGAKTQTLLILPFALVFIWQYQWSLWAVARFC